MKKNRAILILKNTLTNYLRQVVMLATFFVLTPFIAKSLGNDALGLWSLIQATVGFFSLLDLGFAQAVVKYVADARGRQDEERLRNITSTLFWIYAALGAASMAVTLALAPFVPALLGIPKEIAGVARAVFIIIGARSALAFPMGMFSGVLTGFQLQSWSNLIRSTGMLTYGALAMSVLLAMMVSVANGGAANVLTMTGFQRYVALSFVAGQVTNLLLTIALLWLTPLGINGVALSTLAASLFADFWLVARRACREYGVSLPEYLRLTVWPSALPSAVMVGGLWLAEPWLAASSLWRIGVLEAAGCVLFVAAFAVLGLDAKERAYYGERSLYFLGRRRA